MNSSQGESPAIKHHQQGDPIEFVDGTLVGGNYDRRGRRELPLAIAAITLDLART